MPGATPTRRLGIVDRHLRCAFLAAAGMDTECRQRHSNRWLLILAHAGRADSMILILYGFHTTWWVSPVRAE